MPIVNRNGTTREVETSTTSFKSPYTSTITDGVNGGKDDREKAKLTEDLNKSDSLLRRTLRANGIFEPRDMDFNRGFYRFPRNDPYNYVDGAREYLFFTKPDLPLLDMNGELLEDAAKVSYFRNLADSPGYRKSVFWNLCSHYGNAHADSRIDRCPFMRILSNRKTSNMDVPDINVEEMETAVNMFGSKIYYPKSSMSSDENVDFSIEFEDTKFLEIYHLFKTWDYYRQLKWLGILGPAANIPKIDEASYNHYAQYCYYKILYDHISVYKFLVSTDGNTILFMSKGIGVYPKTISRSSFSEIQDRGPLKITIGFKISGWLEDSTPNIVADFNTLIENWIVGGETKEPPWQGNNAAALWDDEIGMISQELMDYPFIYYDGLNSGDEPNANRPGQFRQFKLLWVPFKNTSGPVVRTNNK